MKTDLSDETLCAFLDGELSLERRRAVEAALEQDAKARARLAMFARGDEALRRDFPLRVFSRFDRLADKIMAGGAVRPASVPLTAAITALAAGLAGFLIGQLDFVRAPAFVREPSPVGSSIAGLVAQGRLANMLETQPSSHAGGDAFVLASFRAKDGRFCREFEIGAPAARDSGIACRDSGGWRVVAWAAAPGPSADAYRPAGAEQLIEAMVDDLGGEVTLTPSQEAALVGDGWRED